MNNISKCPFCGASKICENNTPWILYECGTKGPIRANVSNFHTTIKQSEQCQRLCKSIEKYKKAMNKMANKGIRVSFEIKHVSEP